MSSPSSICLESQFKQRIPHVKSVIQSTLGVGVSTTHSYDILAVSQGFSNYQSAKGRAQMPYYEWGLNIGTAQSPYFIMKAIGHHRNTEEARSAGESLLSGSPDHATWILFENGQATTISFRAHNDVLSWDFRNVYASLEQAVKHHVSELRLRQVGGKLVVDHQTRKGWVSNCVLSDVCSNNPSNIMSQLKALADHTDKEHQPTLLSFSIQFDGVLVHVRVHVVMTQDGPIINIHLHDPVAGQYFGALLEGCPAFQRLRTDVNEAKNGLFLIIGRTGSGRTTAMTYLMTTRLSSQKNTLNSRSVLGEINPITSLSMSDIQKQLMHSDADIICAGEIRDRNSLVAAIDAARTTPVIAQLHASDSGVLSRLQAMGADINSVHGVLKGVYSQCLMRSADQGVVIPVSSYLHLNDGKLVGPTLLEDAWLLHLRGGISDREMHNQFGQDFEQLTVG